MVERAVFNHSVFLDSRQYDVRLASAHDFGCASRMPFRGETQETVGVDEPQERQLTWAASTS